MSKHRPVPYRFIKGQYAPTLYIDFVNEGMDKGQAQLISITRASKGWHFNSSGLLVEAATDVRRIAHNPANGSPLGLLVEEARTNQSLWSNDLTNAIWNKRGTVGVALGSSSDGPDGTSNYSRVTNLTGLASNDVYQQPVTYGASARYEQVMMLRKQVSAGILRIAAPTGVGEWTINFATFPSGWQLVNRTTPGVTINTEFTSSGAGGGGTLFCRHSGSEVLAFDVAYVNTQLGTFPTSPIKTTSAAVTRAADVATITDMAWFRADEGTLFAEWSQPALNSGRSSHIVNINDGTASNEVVQFVNASAVPTYAVLSGGVGLVGIGIGTVSAGQVNKMASAYRADDCNAARNGVLGTPDTAATLPTGLDRLSIGDNAAGARNLNGYLRRIAYYPRRMSNATLQALTT